MPSSEGLKTFLIFIRSGVGVYNRGGLVGTLTKSLPVESLDLLLIQLLLLFHLLQFLPSSFFYVACEVLP